MAEEIRFLEAVPQLRGRERRRFLLVFSIAPKIENPAPVDDARLVELTAAGLLSTEEAAAVGAGELALEETEIECAEEAPEEEGLERLRTFHAKHGPVLIAGLRRRAGHKLAGKRFDARASVEPMAAGAGEEVR